MINSFAVALAAITFMSATPTLMVAPVEVHLRNGEGHTVIVPPESVLRVTQTHAPETSVTFTAGCFTLDPATGMSVLVAAYRPVFERPVSVTRSGEDRWTLVQVLRIPNSCPTGTLHGIAADAVDGDVDLTFERVPAGMQPEELEV